jgi:DNA-binding NtrC family response regulator
MSGDQEGAASGARYLIVRGKATAYRIALPALGSLSLGDADESEIKIRESGVAKEHAVLFLDHGIGLRVLAENSSLITPGAKERTLEVGQTAELNLGDVVRLGSAELSFQAAKPSTDARRILTRGFFEQRLSHLLVDTDKPAAAVMRIELTGGAEKDAFEKELLVRVRPNDLVARFKEGEYAILMREVTEAFARKIAHELTDRLLAIGAEIRVGIAQAEVASPKEVLELAEGTMSRPSQGSERPALVISRDPDMIKLAKLIDRVAKSTNHVLILGETGVGKDLVAQMIHDKSDRAHRPFVRVSCVDLSDSFLEEDATNFLARARGGSVHLDEVGGLSTRAQLSLGYLIEEAPSSGHDVRFVASTNHDLDADVNGGSFRKDLFFRLNQVTIAVPPLRARSSDVVPLAEMFVEQAARTLKRAPPKISDAAKQKLSDYAWPGNVRELKNILERALLLCTDTLGLEHLPPKVLGQARAPAAIVPGTSQLGDDDGPRPASLREEIAALEKKRILEALQRYPTQRDAALALDMPMRTFLNRLDALGIPRARGGGQKDDKEE